MASGRSLHNMILYRSISSTPRLDAFGWFEKIKSVFTGKPSTKPSTEPSTEPPPQPAKKPAKTSFSLLEFADQMDKARRVRSFKDFRVGRASEATVSESFKKQSAVLRYLGAIDPTGENLQPSHKKQAMKQFNCTISEVENMLGRYTWAKEAQYKIDKLKEEGKQLPKSFSEVQKLMGSSPLDVSRSNLAKSGQIGRNAACPCGSGKRYKWCCGKT